MYDVLLGLMLVAAFTCFLAYWAFWAVKDDISLIGALVKTGATGLVALPLLLDGLRLSSSSGPHAYISSFLGLMTLGLAFGALGDFALTRKGQKAFLAGMLAFAIGHLLYAFALWHRTQNIIQSDLTYDAGQAFAGGAISIAQIVALAALAALLLSTEVWLAPKTGNLRWPVRGYVLVIGAMAAVTILLLPNMGTAMLRLGASLFVLSDLLLALRLFVVTSTGWQARLSLMLWPAYWLGQMLLLFGAIAYGISPKG